MDVKDTIATAKSYLQQVYAGSEQISDLSDAIMLTACAASGGGDDRIELLTADTPVYNRALSLGLPAELYA